MGEVAEAKPETATAVFRLLADGSLEPLPRHRHGLSRDDIQEAQRVRITAAAIELFAANGYAATSVLTNAKRAGVSSKTYQAVVPRRSRTNKTLPQLAPQIAELVRLVVIPNYRRHA